MLSRGGNVVRGAGTLSGGRDNCQGAWMSSGKRGCHSDVRDCYNVLVERCYCYNAVE